jgi:hypothetical protein
MLPQWTRAQIVKRLTPSQLLNRFYSFMQQNIKWLCIFRRLFEVPSFTSASIAPKPQVPAPPCWY